MANRMRGAPLLAGLLAMGTLVAACSGSTPDAPARPTLEEAPPAATAPPFDPSVAPTVAFNAIPPLDRSKSTVPIEEVVFDTFDGRFVRLPAASDALIDSLHDLIPPVYAPVYETNEAASNAADGWLFPMDRVIGIEIDGQAYAYPVKTLTFREIVNDTLGGQPLLVSYCPLCASGVVYQRTLDGRPLVFGNTSGLYNNDMVMVDHQTGSFWHQVTGEAIAGEVAGAQLEPMPAMTVRFGEWTALHPDGLVLANSKDQARRALDPTEQIQASVNRGSFFFPIDEKSTSDERLDLGALVVVIKLAGQWRAYPLQTGPAWALNDLAAGVPVAVLGAGDSAGVFVAEVDGRRLTFTGNQGAPGGQSKFSDAETGSTWDLAGRAVAGALKGQRLQAIPSRRSFWFAVAGGIPGIELA